MGVDLDAWRQRPHRAGVITDFDGTLAPIVADAATAQALPGVLEVLDALAARLGLVAAVSGRPAAFLAERLPVPGMQQVGLYGLERRVEGRTVVVAEAEGWRPALHQLANDAVSLGPAGVAVEDKGVAVTLHVRADPSRLPWIERFVTERAEPLGLVGHPGKLSVEIRPPVEVDKGTVVAELAADLDAVCFCGDDRGDLPAFAALAELRRAGATTVGVAVAGDETPQAVLDAADLLVDGPAGALAFLRSLLPGGAASVL